MKCNRVKKILWVVSAAVGLLGMTACTSLPFPEKDDSDEILEEVEKDEEDSETGDTNDHSEVVNIAEMSEQDFMKMAAEETINAMLELSKDEVYISTMTSSDDMLEIASGWGQVTIDRAQDIQVILLPEETLQQFLEDMDVSGELSETAKDYLMTTFGANATNIVNARAGANTMATASLLRYSRSYAVDFEIENQIWFIATNDEGVGISVSFSRTGEGVITVNSSYTVNTEGSAAHTLVMNYFDVTGDNIRTIEW